MLPAGKRGEAFASPLFFLTITLFVLLTLLTKGNNDIWLHLKTGEIIFSERAIPHHDIYSFTAFGNTWICHSWLSQLTLFLIHRHFSTGGLIAFRLALTTGAVCFCFAACRLRRVSGAVSSFLLFLMAFSNWTMFITRPHLFSYLFLSIYLYILESYRLRGRNLLFFIPVLQIFWCNLHAGSLLGILIVVIYALGLQFERKHLDKKIISVTLLSIIASLINPNGFHLYSYVMGLSRSNVFSSLIYEWRSPFSALWVDYIFVYFFSEWFFITIFALLMKLKRKAWLDSIFIFLFLYLSSRAARHIGLAMIFLLPVIGEEITNFIRYCGKKWDISKLRITTKLIFSLCLSYAIFHIIVYGLSPKKGTMSCKIGMRMGFDMPEKAVDYVLENNLPGEIFNSYDYGAYLIYRLYPERKVYIDGRIAMYGEKLARELFGLSDVKMDEILEKYGINTALISYRDPERLHIYFMKRDFTLVYSDKYVRIYTR